MNYLRIIIFSFLVGFVVCGYESNYGQQRVVEKLKQALDFNDSESKEIEKKIVFVTETKTINKQCKIKTVTETAIETDYKTIYDRETKTVYRDQETTTVYVEPETITVTKRHTKRVTETVTDCKKATKTTTLLTTTTKKRTKTSTGLATTTRVENTTSTTVSTQTETRTTTEISIGTQILSTTTTSVSVSTVSGFFFKLFSFFGRKILISFYLPFLKMSSSLCLN